MPRICQAKITSKGEITIPKELREKYHLSEGETIHLIPTEEGIMMKHGKITTKALRGLMKEEIDVDKASRCIKELRQSWRL